MSRPRVLLTAGGTREPVDDVRYLSNVATGSLPAAMAEALLCRGFDVDYVYGPGAQRPGQLGLDVSLLAPDWAEALAAEQARAQARAAALAAGGGTLTLHPIQSAADADATLRRVLAQSRPALVACAMAVADYAPRRVAGKLGSRLRRDVDPDAPALTLALDATAKVIDGVREVLPEARLLGFKLLSGADEAAHVEASRALAERSGADWVFSNDMRDYGVGRRCGALRGPDGVARVRLDGGEGGGALDRLAEALVAAVLDAAGLVGVGRGAAG